MTITGTGIWAFQLRYLDPGEIADAAAELESLGYAAVWIPDVGGDVFEALDRLVAATSSLTVATGVLNIWAHTAADTAAWWQETNPDLRERLLLGLGASHAEIIGDAWRRPVSAMRAYVDDLTAAGVPRSAHCLAALGPKMLELARDRSSGAHPYLATPEHTARAREALGAGALLAPEQGVVLETDPERARAVAREAIEGYRALPNYTNNWRRLGFTDDDIESCSDRLVDGLVAWGDADAIAARVAAHRAAGADHVCLQVLTTRGSPMPRAAWRELAAAVV